ncbi:hypothetical protein IMG5_155080 [Ichthyophthirius multifiliis]|uniref:Uncharacterized protein n=1 Tax=Ichthyophthirius multifiliis TaxID=5932 RepID=G0QZ83_ICHMU|nr:hypothetical protein IMG5_155080 [Ichthyophthirius multifiliis]EGR29466.1 hypothetical protein IMG5_155080 [Ichthyophthirius multifiliis]|eukprot:XP_004030702.1 hypothetical protein IMG5_155080 [Ichthyophthirius multifiliis]
MRNSQIIQIIIRKFLLSLRLKKLKIQSIIILKLMLKNQKKLFLVKILQNIQILRKPQIYKKNTFLNQKLRNQSKIRKKGLQVLLMYQCQLIDLKEKDIKILFRKKMISKKCLKKKILLKKKLNQCRKNQKKQDFIRKIQESDYLDLYLNYKKGEFYKMITQFFQEETKIWIPLKMGLLRKKMKGFNQNIGMKQERL